MKSLPVQISEAEANIIISLCDMALRKEGLKAAQNVLPIVNKMGEHIQSINAPKEEVPQPDLG